MIKTLFFFLTVLFLCAELFAASSKDTIQSKKEDEYFMKIAFSEIARHPDEEFPIGAVVVFDHQLVSVGYNRISSTNDVRDHAEMDAMDAALISMNRGRLALAGTTLYTTLEPCPMCAGAMTVLGVNRVVVCQEDKLNGALSEVENWLSAPKISWLDAAECQELNRGPGFTKKESREKIRLIAAEHLEEIEAMR